MSLTSHFHNTTRAVYSHMHASIKDSCAKKRVCSGTFKSYFLSIKPALRNGSLHLNCVCNCLLRLTDNGTELFKAYQAGYLSAE